MVRGVCRSFDNGRSHALRGVSFTVARGESVAVTGPSGSGKSTLLHLIGAIDRPTSGEIVVDGRAPGTEAERAAFRARTVGFVFQSFNLLPTLTASENVQVPMFERGVTANQVRNALRKRLAPRKMPRAARVMTAARSARPR